MSEGGRYYESRLRETARDGRLFSADAGAQTRVNGDGSMKILVDLWAGESTKNENRLGQSRRKTVAHQSILGSCKLTAFVPTRDIARARDFYESVLGLPLASDHAPVALVFDAHGTMLRVTAVGEYTPDLFTVLGWQVDSIESAVNQLIAAGVSFLRYKGMNESDPRGIWTSPAGARVAWFHDPDQNVLSVTELPQSAE